MKSIKQKNEPVSIEKVSDSVKTEDNSLMFMLEALLFASGKYMDESDLAQLCGSDKRKVRKALENLKEYYESRDNSLAVFQEQELWKINVKEKYSSLVRKIVSDTELNKSSMETLAVIAWKSPIFQSEVVRIRGNKCYDHIDELEEMGFVTKDKKGRSYILKTTEKFFNYFDIDKKHISQLLAEVKAPEHIEQTTLPTATIPENATNKIHEIEIRKKVETEEEKEAYTTFLNEMEQKLVEAAQKNSALDEEFPTRKTSDLPKQSITDLPIQSTSDLSTKDTTSDLPKTENTSDLSTPVDEIKKKSLTKKQLEKKFKDELLRVREKMEKK